MASIPNRTKPIAGAKYRVATWHDITKRDEQMNPELVGFGLQEKQAGKKRYQLVAWCLDITPWKTRKEADEAVKRLNEQASAAAIAAAKENK